MTTLIGAKLKDKDAAAWLSSLAYHLHPGEKVAALTKTNLLQPNCNAVAITNARIVAFHSRDVAHKGVKREIAADQIGQVEGSNKVSGSFLIVTKSGQTVTFGALSRADFDLIRGAAERLTAAGVDPEIAAKLTAERARAERAADAWAQIEVFGEPPSDRTWQVLKDYAPAGEFAWFAIGTKDRGVFAAFSEHCMIVKIGGIAGFSARSPGAGITTFRYADITEVEYRAGAMDVTVELLTARPEDSPRRAQWGSNIGGAYASSNAFRLDKNTFSNALPRLNEMRLKMAEAKRAEQS
jgi:hypothetical protein